MQNLFLIVLNFQYFINIYRYNETKTDIFDIFIIFNGEFKIKLATIQIYNGRISLRT